MKFSSFLFFLAWVQQAVASTMIFTPQHAPEDLDGAWTRRISHFELPPEYNAAAGTFIFAEHDNTIKVLLGARDDCGHLCNLGGKADLSDITFASIAARETAEESVLYYAQHPDLLRRLASHTLIDEEGLAYCMFFTKEKYVPADVLNRAMETSEHSSSQEYTYFTWIDLKDLLVSITKGNNTVRVDDEEIEIYDPLLRMLQSEPSRYHMQNILEGKRDRLVHTIEYDRGVPDLTTIPHPPKWEWREDDNGIYALYEEGVCVEYFESPDSALKTLAHSVAAKALLNVDVKRNIPLFVGEYDRENDNNITLLDETEQVAYLWNPDYEYTPTEIHLKLVLAEDYQEGHTIEAYSANLTNYFERFDTAEFKRNIQPTEADIDQLAHIMLTEYEHRHLCPMVHGLTGELLSLYQMFQTLREILLIHPLEQIVLRGNNMFAYDESGGPIETIAQAVELYGDREYQGVNQSAFMSTNPILSAGLLTTRSSSCTVEYFLNSHSVASPLVDEKYYEAMALIGGRGFSPALMALFKQYYSANPVDESNGGLIQFFFAPEEVDRLGFTGDHSTHRIDWHTLYEQAPEGESSLMFMYQLIQEVLSSNESTDMELYRTRFQEARIFLNSTALQNPTRVKTFEYYKRPLAEKEATEYRSKQRALAVAEIACVLTSNVAPFPHTLADGANIWKLRDQVFADVLGMKDEDIQLRTGFDAFLHFINGGYIGPAKMLFALDPESCRTSIIGNEERIVSQLLSNNSPDLETMEFMIKDVMGLNGIDELFSEKNLKVMVLGAGELDFCKLGILSQAGLLSYDTFSRELLRSFLLELNVKYFHNKKAVIDILEYCFPNVELDDFKGLLSTGNIMVETESDEYCQDISKYIAKADLIGAEHVFENGETVFSVLAELIQDSTIHLSHDQISPLVYKLCHDVRDWSAVTPATGIPILFDVLKLLPHYFFGRPFDLPLETYLQGMRDAQGRNVFQYLTDESRSEKSNLQNMSKDYLIKLTDSIPLSDPVHIDVALLPKWDAFHINTDDFRKWHKSLRRILEEGIAEGNHEILHSDYIAYLPNCLSFKTKNRELCVRLKLSVEAAAKRKMEQRQKVEKAFSSPDFNAQNNVLNNVPMATCIKVFLNSCTLGSIGAGNIHPDILVDTIVHIQNYLHNTNQNTVNSFSIGDIIRQHASLITLEMAEKLMLADVGLAIEILSLSRTSYVPLPYNLDGGFLYQYLLDHPEIYSVNKYSYVQIFVESLREYFLSEPAAFLPYVSFVLEHMSIQEAWEVEELTDIGTELDQLDELIKVLHPQIQTLKILDLPFTEWLSIKIENTQNPKDKKQMIKLQKAITKNCMKD